MPLRAIAIYLELALLEFIISICVRNGRRDWCRKKRGERVILEGDGWRNTECSESEEEGDAEGRRRRASSGFLQEVAGSS